MKDPISQIKAWLFPSVITLLAAIIWNDVKEIKTDVKALMAQSNIDKTRIDNLERMIYKSSTPTGFPGRDDDQKYKLTMAAITPNTKELEDSVKIKKRKS